MSKRGNNEGTVFKVKGKNLWSGRVTMQDKTVENINQFIITGG